MNGEGPGWVLAEREDIRDGATGMAEEWPLPGRGGMQDAGCRAELSTANSRLVTGHAKGGTDRAGALPTVLCCRTL